MNATTYLPLAHAGHWAFYIVYAVPVIVVLASVFVTVRRERRLEAEGEERSIPPREP